MSKDEHLTERLREYQEYASKETRFKTKEEFKEFCKTNHVFYRHGFGGYIQSLIRTEEEFINFMLKCCQMHHGEYFPWFVNDYDHENENQHIFFTEEFMNSMMESFTDENGTFTGSFPSVPIVAYAAEYNPYYDDPFEVHRVDDFMTYPPNTFRVNPKTSAKFPAIVRFVSMDTFDRMGSIRGQDLTIISLADVEDGQMMFL